MGIIPVPVRIVFKIKFNFSRICCHEFFDGRTGRSAVRSLEVEKFYNGNRCIGRPPENCMVKGDVMSLLLARSDKGN
jgi:hypothetical protein